MRKVDDNIVLQLLREGKNQREIADYFQVSPVAICKRLKRIFPKPSRLGNLTPKEQKFAVKKLHGNTGRPHPSKGKHINYPATRAKIRAPRKNSKSEAILTLTTITPASPTEIAESVQCSVSNVSQVLKRYNIIPNKLESFKKFRADVYAGIAEKVASQLSDAIPKIEIKNSRDLKDSAIALGILYDKENLELGKPTGIIDIRALVVEVEAREREILAKLEPPKEEPK